MDLHVGTEFAGHRIEAVVGRGGAGVVYLAEHLRLGRKVALKVLAPHLAGDDSFRERFIKESQIAAGLDHPNVVTVYDAGEIDDSLYLSMRLIQGTDLRQLLLSENALDPPRAVAILSQIASALDAAHAEGLVHRDVKPENILVQAENDHPGTDRAYLSDFGISKRTTSHGGLTVTGQFVGTVDYVAPEQITGEPVDGRTDVYSLGCVLFECVSGRVPFPREIEVATIYSHLHDPPPRVGTGESVRGLNDVVAKALAKNKEERYETCGALTDAARSATVGMPSGVIELTPSRLGAESPVPRRPPREVRKTVTIIFCDVTGSTALGERLDPEALRDMQSQYFDAIRDAIERHGGTIERHIGDTVMAIFGIPQLHEDDALRAVRAAADVRESLTSLNKELERDRGVTIQVRIGVNTGEVVAGDSAAGQPLVTGDAVNVAARFGQQAAPGAVLLSDATHRLVHGAVDAEAVEPLELRDRAERVPAWRLLDARDVTSSVPRRLDSPMVGRSRQLAQLRQAFDAVVDDASCQLFTVLGPAGIGKSRLVDEFLSALGGDAEVLRGRCLPYGEGITYFPVVEAVKEAAGLADFDLPDVIEAKVCSVLEGDEHQEVVCRHVAQLMGATDTMAGEEAFWAIRRFFEAVARDRPLVLVLDDIHWGESTFLDLVEHIADWSRGFPILVLCMARSELLDLRPTWGGGKPNAATVSLEPLSEEQTETLISNLLGSVELPAEIAWRIIQTTEGNPLFVEHMLAMLVDDGLVARDDGRWAAVGDLSGMTVPRSIQALLAARVDRLSPDERNVLEAAAVVGKMFFVGAVRDLLRQDEAQPLATNLMSLVRKDLIRAERTSLPGQDAFRFRHLLVRDAAYEAIPKTRRGELHERFADWLEGIAGDAIVEQEEIVAYHLEQVHAYRTQLGPADERTAAIARRAAAHLASAGRRATRRGDEVAASNLFRRAVALAPPGRERAADLYELGMSLEWVTVQERFAIFDEAIQQAADAGDRSLEWLARIQRSSVKMLVDPHGTSTDEFRAELEQAMRLFEQLQDDHGLATVWAALAEVEWMPCRFDRASDALRHAIEHARRSGDERLLTAILPSFVGGATIYGTTTPEQGLHRIETMREELSRTRILESLRLGVTAFHRSMQGRLDEARRFIAEAADIAASFGLRWTQAAYAEQLGDIEMLAGDAGAAERAYRRGYEILDELGDESHKSGAAVSVARVLCALGRYDEAEAFSEIARRVAAEDDLGSQAGGRQAQASVLAARGELEEAIRLASEAVQMFADADAECPNIEANAWMDLAQVQRTARNPAEAERAARHALALYERKGNRPLSDSARAFMDQVTAQL